jgi:3-keto-5-aminohexanoate cleavage enzyme
MNPLIIEAAINGVTNKGRNPNVPCTPGEIAADALECLEAGAAIVHNHIDDFSLGPAAYAERQLAGWRPVFEKRPDAILYPTVSVGGSIEQRFGHVPLLAESCPMRMSVFDPGSVNFGGIGDDGLPGGPIDLVYVNTFADIRYEAELCERHGLGPSVSIFEPGFLRAALAYHRKGRLPKGALIKLYFGGDHDYLIGAGEGVGFGLPPTRVSLEAYLSMLEGCDVPWSVAVIGGDVVQTGLARLAIERGGHVRVGLEDHAGARRPANAELVREVAALTRELGRPVADCAAASRILGLPR